MGAHLPDVEFGFESRSRVDVQSKGAINDGRPDRSGSRTPPPCSAGGHASDASESTKRALFWCLLTLTPSVVHSGAPQNRRISVETALDPSAGSISVVQDWWHHRQKLTAVTKEPNVEPCEIVANLATLWPNWPQGRGTD